MRQLIFLLLIMSGSISAPAQIAADFNLWYTQPGDTLMVYAEKAYVRQEPSLQGVIADTLFTGATVVAGKDAGTPLRMKGMIAPWKEVSYGNGKKGYIWLGLLAIKHYTGNDLHFLYGIEKTLPATEEEPVNYLIRLKVVSKDQQVLDMKEWKVRGAEYANASEGKMLDGMGLENIQSIIRIYFSGEACAIPTDYYYFGWTGKQLLVLPGKTNVSDAGVFYSEETLLFPKEPGGQPGKIIKLLLTAEYGDDMETVAKKTTSREIYLWDGTKAVKQTL